LNFVTTLKSCILINLIQLNFVHIGKEYLINSTDKKLKRSDRLKKILTIFAHFREEKDFSTCQSASSVEKS